MRRNCGKHGETRSSALWGSGNRGGDSRSNALWGKGGRSFVSLVAVLAVAVPVATSASTPKNHLRASISGTWVAPSLLRLAKSHPNKLERVIIQSRNGSVAQAAGAFRRVDGLDGAAGDREVLNRRFGSIDSVAATLRADKLTALASQPNLIVSPDAPVKLDGSFTSNQLWPYESLVTKNWGSYTSSQPTIAVVDSGVASRADFGTRLLGNVNLSTLPTNSPGDGRGHGTFVAGIAAGASSGYAGADPSATILSLDVMDDYGVARTSDVIAACQWILANKARYNIRVANFSLHSIVPSNFTKDPLDQAVEKLWFSGVVVVAAAGNYGSATGPSGVLFAPGNDPFVITVGAADIAGTVKKDNDFAAPWSAYGSTYDGFSKPELGAPGRYMIGPVPMTSTLATQKASSITAPGYIQLSGTSFAAPAVAGAAAQILAARPTFTPDQVKGALMVTAEPAGKAAPKSLGVGEINAGKATTINVPPNPNKGLDQFVMPDPLGGPTPVFDAASWADAARANASWDSVSWTDASWSSAIWSVVSWTDVSWTDVSWTDVSLSSVTWSDVSWEDAASRDTSDSAGYPLTPQQARVLLSDPDTAPSLDELPDDVLLALQSSP